MKRWKSRSGVSLIAVGVVLACLTSAVADEGRPSSGVAPMTQGGPKTSGPQDALPMAADEALPAAQASPGVELIKEDDLRARVQARWDALIRRDFSAAYNYESPEYREDHTLQEYTGQFGPRVQWHVASIKDLRYDRPREVEVIINLEYSFDLPGSDRMARTTSAFSERWVFRNDKWWREQPAQPLRGTSKPQPSTPQ